MLKSDFDAIFTIVELEAATGFSSSLDKKLVSRTGEPMPTGLVLGVPAEEHFQDHLAHNVNAGNSDLMITSVGTQGFVDSMPREDQSVCTGPFDIVGTPDEIIQTRRYVFQILFLFVDHITSRSYSFDSFSGFKIGSRATLSVHIIFQWAD